MIPILTRRIFLNATCLELFKKLCFFSKEPLAQDERHKAAFITLCGFVPLREKYAYRRLAGLSRRRFLFSLRLLRHVIRQVKVERVSTEFYPFRRNLIKDNILIDENA